MPSNQHNNSRISYFTFYKKDKNLFYVGYIQSINRKKISQRVIDDKINNNANTFCSVLVLAISKECLVKKKNINTDATIKISSIIIAVLKYLEYLILCIN